MAEDELVDSRASGDAPDLGHIGVQRGHPLQGGTGNAVPLEVAEVGNLVDEDVGTLGESDQIVVHGGVAREHHGAVRGVEPVGQRRDRPAVRHCDDPDPNHFIEDDDRRVLPAVLAGTGMSILRTSAPASGMRASSGMTFRW
jgi:hypothetical protein